jgi:dTDP-4-amino-4,6-dideoxygalactose transaminase
MNVNFVDLKSQYDYLDLTELNEMIKAGQFVGGPHLDKFEEKMAAYCGTKYAVGVGSGTDALWLALLVSGIGPGDEVLVPANTFVATAFAVLM